MLVPFFSISWLLLVVVVRVWCCNVPAPVHSGAYEGEDEQYLASQWRVYRAGEEQIASWQLESLRDTAHGKRRAGGYAAYPGQKYH